MPRVPLYLIAIVPRCRGAARATLCQRLPGPSLRFVRYAAGLRLPRGDPRAGPFAGRDGTPRFAIPEWVPIFSLTAADNWCPRLGRLLGPPTVIASRDLAIASRPLALMHRWSTSNRASQAAG
jgi:hypothetical protein